MLNVLEKRVHVGEGLVLGSCGSPVRPVRHWGGLGCSGLDHPKGRVQHGSDCTKTVLEQLADAKSLKKNKAKQGSRAPRLAAGAEW